MRVGRGIEAIDATLNKLKSQITAIEQVVTAAQQGATQAISGITQAYQGLTGIVDATLQKQLASTQAHYAQKQVLLEQSNASEAKLIKETTQLLVDSVQEQSDLRAQALTETLRLIEQEGQARRFAAQRQAETDEARRAATLRVDNEILAAKQQALAQAAADYVRHVDALNAQANRHLAEIRRIEDEKRALSQTTEERMNWRLPIGTQSLRTDPIDIQAFHDRDYLQRLLRVRKLTSLESGSVDTIKGRWRTAMAQAQVAGVDLERQLMEYIERETERQIYLARGGLAKSDTVLAMLAPGEYVVSRESVKRLGAGFFAAITAMKAPAKAVASKIQGFARGGLVSPNASTRVATVLRNMPTDFEDLAASGSKPRRTAAQLERRAGTKQDHSCRVGQRGTHCECDGSGARRGAAVGSATRSKGPGMNGQT